MRSIPAFSKKSSQGPTVGGNGQRAGFTDHVKSTNSGKAKQVPSMAATYPTKSTIGHTSGAAKAHPSFKTKSDSGCGKKVPAFSKKKI